METKEKLTEIIGNVVVNDKGNRIRDVFHPEFVEKIVKDLIKNGVIVLPYKPFPMVWSEDENSSDVFCPFCDTNLSGHYYGGDYEPPKTVPCFECGTWLDGTKAITREEAEQALKGGEGDA